MAVSRRGRLVVIIVDTALRKREEAGNPVRVGMIGAGFMARGIANSILNSIPGMRLVAIANRTVETAIRAYTEAGADDVAVAETADALQDAIQANRYVVTADPNLVAEADGIDVILEVTGNGRVRRPRRPAGDRAPASTSC